MAFNIGGKWFQDMNEYNNFMAQQSKLPAWAKDPSYKKVAGTPAKTTAKAGASATATASGAPVGSASDIIAQAQKKQDEAFAANQKRYDESLGIRKQAAADQNTAYGNLLGDVTGAWDAAGSKADAEYRRRQQEAMGMLEGMGTQEKKDIAENWRAQGAASQQRLRASGLGNTTIGASLASGNLRNQQADLARTNERLQNQRLGLYTTLSGDTLAAADKYGTGKIGAISGIGGAAIGGAYGGATDVANAIERPTDTYPDQSMLLGLLQNQAQYGGGSSMAVNTSGQVSRPQPYTIGQPRLKTQPAPYTIGQNTHAVQDAAQPAATATVARPRPVGTPNYGTAITGSGTYSSTGTGPAAFGQVKLPNGSWGSPTQYEELEKLRINKLENSWMTKPIPGYEGQGVPSGPGYFPEVTNYAAGDFFTPTNYVESRALGANRTPMGPVDITKPRVTSGAAPAPAKSPQVGGGFLNTSSPEWNARYETAKAEFAKLSPEEQKRRRELDAYNRQFML